METGSPIATAPLRQAGLAEAIAAAQTWWNEAGVDLLFADEPQVWLADPAAAEPAGTAAPANTIQRPVSAAPEPQPVPQLGGDRSTWPQSLEEFATWWASDPSLEAGGLGPRIAPRGAGGAALMVLVPMPEASDSETLLSGPEGRLLAGFAAAAGIAPDQMYVAAALPRHMAAPEWAMLGAAGLGTILQHLIALAAPQRLLVLGRDILPLVGNDPALCAPGSHQLAVQGRTLPMLAHHHPAGLLGHARLRAGLWRHWLDWTQTQ